MLGDAGKVVAGIAGLTNSQREQVVVGVQLLIERLLDGTEDGLRGWADRLNRVRKSITGTGGEWPVISIADEPFVTPDAIRRAGDVE